MPEVVEFVAQRDGANRGDVVRNDDLIHLLERIDANECRCCAIEIELFFHFAQRAVLRRLGMLQKPSDQTVERSERLRPRTIVRKHYHTIVLDDGRDNRGWIVVVNEAAIGRAGAAAFALQRAFGKWGGTEGTELELGHLSGTIIHSADGCETEDVRGP